MPGRLQPINQEAHERPGSHARKSLTRLPLAGRTDFLRTHTRGSPGSIIDDLPGLTSRSALGRKRVSNDESRSTTSTPQPQPMGSHGKRLVAIPSPPASAPFNYA